MFPRRRRKVLYCITLLISLYILVHLLSINTQQDNYKVITLDDINLTASKGDWQPVKGSKFKFFVYSAFYDGRSEPTRQVRIIGTCRTKLPRDEKYWCHLWYDEQALEPVSQPASIKIIREHGNLKYSACFVSCPLGNSSVPIKVSVARNKDDIPTNHLSVINNYNRQEPQPLSVCVKPLHYHYNRTVELLGFLELYKLLGVTHFTFYKHTVSPGVACLLQQYVASGQMSVLPWEVDLVTQVEVRTEDMFAALNDCVYRYMYRYDYVAMVDLDEFIVPRQNENLLQLLDQLDKVKRNRKIGSYGFRNAFFYRNWPDDLSITNSNPLTTRLVTLTKTRMKTKLNPHRMRSKYICKPHLVVEVGNHFVWQHSKSAFAENVNESLAMSHHYRYCEFGGENCINTKSIVDRLTHRYGHQLMDSVTEKWKELNEVCEFHDL